MTHLISFGLRQFIGERADKVMSVVSVHFSDHSKALPKALARADDRACKTMAVALSGDDWISSIKTFFASADDKGLREEVQKLLENSPVPLKTTKTFRQ